MSASVSKIESALTRSWRWTLTYGIMCVLVGLAVLFWPRETLRIAAILFAVQLIAASVFRFVVTFSRSGDSIVRKLQMAALASFALVIGIVLLENVRLSLRLMLIVLGLYWGIHGAIELVEAIGHSCRTDRTWVLASGIMGVVVGLLLVLVAAFPLAWPAFLVPLVLTIRTLGVWLVVFGVILVVRAFRDRFLHPATGTRSGLRPAGT